MHGVVIPAVAGAVVYDDRAGGANRAGAVAPRMRRAHPQNARIATHTPGMVELSPGEEIAAARPVLPSWRPAVFFTCVGLTIAGLIWLAAFALSPGGTGAIDLVLVALFAVTLPWYVIGFWNATIGLTIMRLAADPVAAVTPVAGRVRGDEPITSSTAILLCIRNEPSERGRTPARAVARRARRTRRRWPLSRLRAERHQQRCHRRLRGGALCGADRILARKGRDDLPAAHRQCRLQGRKRRGLLRALGQGARFRGDARRRQRHDGRPRAQARAHHADRAAARHPAEPGDRHAVGQRVRPHLPVRNAAGHAFLHHRQRLVAGRMRAVLGPQRDRADRPVHRALPAAGARRGARWSAAMCSATTRSKRC